MAEEQEYDFSPEPTIYFYVNKETESVAYVAMYTIFGITVRPKGEKWRSGSRDDLEKYYSSSYEIWSYEWDNLDDTPGSGANLDPDDEDGWEIDLIRDWAKGSTLSRADIEKFCRMVSSGDYVTKEEAESFPGK
jgi:hypothetical protein